MMKLITKEKKAFINELRIDIDKTIYIKKCVNIFSHVKNVKKNQTFVQKKHFIRFEFHFCEKKSI